ncbi:ribosomal protein S18-alanine N-acetyltransferase [Pseudobacteroides cellulosolvens]|uniref:Ribosomal-protein-alanine acetyltransferase n=1 Tax=Pseudobacteroides cellulosolvens ATCC 35603 = DSM 2933 TaxID=398512 RepID=A0A0L6JN21_9FIRM|nr:ribosomal protein S18-alanine N-acetyltransferase [Pseudobacteroides cellulosolvens]KNY27140.1 ribosomal-protein-alanine acetyltransferase [Pseudobacteroides cellulosolvens ATCC 35603 = DSM 2933]
MTEDAEIKPMSEIKVVPMALEHVDDIMIVENLSFSIPWSKAAFIEEITKNSFAYYYAGMFEGKAIGYGGMWQVFDEGHITNIAIHPEFRKIGVGSSILEHMIGESIKKGILRMTLEVRKSNESALKLYQKYGFVNEGIRKSYYADNGEDAIIMWKHEMSFNIKKQ